MHLRRARVEPAGEVAHPAALAGDFVRIDVRDTGIGMDEATRQSIFEPFFTTKPPDQGTGLGLAMVHGIVTQHGGVVLVDSAPGRGSVFSVYLPRLEADIAKETTALRVEVSDLTRLRGSETVLVAEDDDRVRRLVVGLLRSLGYAVLEATDGRHALEVARAHRGDLHLLVTDVRMAGLGGIDLAGVLTAERPNTAVVYLSACTDDHLPGDAPFVEGVNFVAKPFSVGRLAETVRTALEAQYRRRITPQGSWLSHLDLEARLAEQRRGVSPAGE